MKGFSSRFLAIAAFMAIVVMASQVAMAQNEKGRGGRGGRGGPGGPGGRGMGPVSMTQLATVDKVQQALKLKDEQKSKIETINKESRDEMRKAYQDGNVDPEKRQKMMEATSAKLKEVLDGGQQKRLMGIFIQVNGMASIMDPAVAKELKITDEQKTKLREEMRGMREGRGENVSPEDRKAKAEKMVKSVLTDEQQKKLEELKGEKVDIDMSKLRPGGREGRGDRPRRGKGDKAEKSAA